MMNDLNSILIEGEVVERMMVCEESCWLKIKSRRYINGDEGQLEPRYTTMHAVLHGNQAKRLYECRPGRVVRLVGHLAQFNDTTFVEAEHVELRPERSDEPGR